MGAGDGVAAKEISATPGEARLPGKICVCEAMVAIFPAYDGNSKFLEFRRGRSTTVSHLGDFEDTRERAQVPARFASNTTHRVHRVRRSIEFLALRNGRRAGTYGNRESAVGVARAPTPVPRVAAMEKPRREGRGQVLLYLSRDAH